MLISREILLRPNDEQRRLLGQSCGFQRWTYNTLLENFKASIADTPEGEPWQFNEVVKALRQERKSNPDMEWTRELNPAIFDNAARNLMRALQRWNACRKGEHKWHPPDTCGFPRRHKRTARRDGFTASDGHPERNKIRQRHIRLPKIGWVAMRDDAPTDQPRQIAVASGSKTYGSMAIFSGLNMQSTCILTLGECYVHGASLIDQHAYRPL